MLSLHDMHPDPPAPRTTLPRGLIVAVLVGGAWRVWMLLFRKWHRPLLLNDSLYYSAQARQLADGVFFREIFVDQPGAEHGPLTSVLMAPVSWVADPVPWQRLVTVLCGIATIAVIGVLAARLAGPLAGAFAGWIAAVYPNLWMNDGLVMSESVSVLLVALFLVAMHGAAHDLSPRRAAVIGALVGLATLARSELVLLAPGAALVLLLVDSHVTVAHAPVGDRTDDGTDRRARGADLKRPAVLLVVAAMVVAPWVAFNLARFERPVTLSTNDGTTLLGTYCDRTFSGSQKGGWSLFCVTEDDPAYSADEEPSVRSARQRSLAIAYARGHLSELPGVVAARLGRTFDLYGLRSLVDQDIGEERSRSASWAGIVAWWMLAVVALFGFRRVRRRDRQILLLPVVAVLVTTIVFYGGHRIRSSMEPTVVVFAAIALAAWAKRTEKTGATTATGTATGTAAEAVTGTATG